MRCQLIANPAARARVDLGSFCLPDRAPLYFHRKLPGYAPTPLVTAPHLAKRLAVKEVIIKDESCRLGLPSFKILGASWAVYKAIIEQWGVEAGAWSDLGELRQRLRPLGKRALAAATDGNHGRAVARMARLFSWQARIFVPSGTAGARIRAIESEGATVTVVQGTYDDAVERSASEESATTLVISDTSWQGYERSPRHVIEGYSTLFHEVADELAREGLAQPSVVAIQAGVGSLAAASVLYFRTGESESHAELVVVEPENANCVLESVRAGRPTQVPDPHRSIMAGLNCGRPSPLAFPLLLQGVDAFMTVDDESAREAMRALAKASIVAGPSGAAGLAGLLAIVDGERPEYRQILGLSPDARVLVINTEGATDPEEYAAIVGGEETGGSTHAR